jgi:glycosyltransferase involved in cell wall biosynthesis
MPDKIKFVEINYHYHQEFTNPAEAISKHRPSNLFIDAFKTIADVVLVKHINYNGEQITDGVQYYFSKSKNGFTHTPFATHRYVKKQQPDLVLVQGFIFPLQVIALRMKIGRQAIIILQHHGEVPFKRKRIFQRLADKMTDGYVFASQENAVEWINAGVIADKNKCFEMPSASTTFLKLVKTTSKIKLGMKENINFLWVGRLNANKDPLTIIAAFEKYVSFNKQARLYMIYQEDDLLELVQQRIKQKDGLDENIILVGKVPHEQLQDWYSAADYFILTSHREGGSYALMEAMACGCVPIVSKIPASMKMIENGSAGFYFETGNKDQLYDILLSLKPGEYPAFSQAAEESFNLHMSPKAIADKLYGVYETLKSQ